MEILCAQMIDAIECKIEAPSHERQEHETHTKNNGD